MLTTKMNVRSIMIMIIRVFNVCYYIVNDRSKCMQEGGEDVFSSGEEMGKQWASIYSQKWTGASTDQGSL